MPASSVLVVDDDSIVRETIRSFLEKHGYAVREAGDGQDALASLARSPADIVLLDILMPRKEGLETLIELKRRFPGILVYAMSASRGRKGHDFLAIASKFGADGILRKPFTAAQLFALIRPEPAKPDTTSPGARIAN